MVLSAGAGRAAAWGLAAALLAAPGCMRTERTDAAVQRSLYSSLQDCDLRVAAQPEHNALTLGYEFTNRSGKTAFLFNLLHRTGPSGGDEPNPDLVYVHQNGGLLVVAKRVLPVPDNIDVEKPDVPYVTRVDPGQSFREKLTLPLPLTLWSPYPGAPRAALPEMEVWFELGFFLAPDPTVAKQAKGHLEIYPFRADQQTILTAGPLGRYPVR
jgi:hypothetical protein